MGIGRILSPLSQVSLLKMLLKLKIHPKKATARKKAVARKATTSISTKMHRISKKSTVSADMIVPTISIEYSQVVKPNKALVGVWLHG